MPGQEDANTVDTVNCRGRLGRVPWTCQDDWEQILKGKDVPAGGGSTSEGASWPPAIFGQRDHSGGWMLTRRTSGGVDVQGDKVVVAALEGAEDARGLRRGAPEALDGVDVGILLTRAQRAPAGLSAGLRIGYNSCLRYTILS